MDQKQTARLQQHDCSGVTPGFPLSPVGKHDRFRQRTYYDTYLILTRRYYSQNTNRMQELIKNIYPKEYLK